MPRGGADRIVGNCLHAAERCLKVKAYLGGVSPWCYEVCAAKGGQEIVERNLVGDVHGRQP